MSAAASNPDITGEKLAFKMGKQTVYVHKNVICASSKLIRDITSTSSHYVCTIGLGDIDPKLFNLYGYWLYNREESFDVRFSAWSGVKRYSNLINCYVLGETLEDADFRNDCIDTFIKFAKETRIMAAFNIPPPEMVKTIYDGTPVGSPARKLMVDMWAADLNTDYLQHVHNFAATTGAEFLEDLIRAMAVQRSPLGALWRNGEGYHV